MKKVLISVLIASLPGIALADSTQDQIAALKAQLAATLNANVTALGIWTTNQTRLAMALAEDSELQSAAEAILQAPPPARREFRAASWRAAFASPTRRFPIFRSMPVRRSTTRAVAST